MSSVPTALPGYETQRFNMEWRKFAEAMRAVDPTIKLVGPDTNQFTADSANKSQRSSTAKIGWKNF